METGIQSWLINWFVDNADVTEEEAKQNTTENFFHNGWLDSFRFISFVSEIEEEFEISFSNDQFQDRDFATIKGMTEIMERMVAKNEK